MQRFNLHCKLLISELVYMSSTIVRYQKAACQAGGGDFLQYQKKFLTKKSKSVFLKAENPRNYV